MIVRGPDERRNAQTVSEMGRGQAPAPGRHRSVRPSLHRVLRALRRCGCRPLPSPSRKGYNKRLQRPALHHLRGHTRRRGRCHRYAEAARRRQPPPGRRVLLRSQRLGPRPRRIQSAHQSGEGRQDNLPQQDLLQRAVQGQFQRMLQHPLRKVRQPVRIRGGRPPLRKRVPQLQRHHHPQRGLRGCNGPRWGGGHSYTSTLPTTAPGTRASPATRPAGSAGRTRSVSGTSWRSSPNAAPDAF